MAEVGEIRPIGKMRTVKALAPFRSGNATSQAQAARRSARVRSRPIPPPQLDFETRIPINRVEDIVSARQTGRALVQEMGLSGSRMTLVTTAISELARNILLYARKGEIVLSRLNSFDQLAVSVTAIDQGPGIENLAAVMAGGQSTSGGLGMGLCGLRRIVDTFEIRTQPGKGTQVFVSIRA